MKTLLIIPAYNEGGNLSGLLDKIRNTGGDYDILVINDCSTDDTSRVCREACVNVIDLPVNLGIGGAVQTGFKYARDLGYDIAVQVDGDGQHQPEYIQSLVDKINEGYSMCIGSRFIEGEGYQSTIIRRTGINFYKFLIKLLTGHSFTDPTSGFRAFDREAIKIFSRAYPTDYAEPESIITVLKRKMKIAEIPVVMNGRSKGKSSISSFKSIYYMIKVTLAMLIARMGTRR